MSLELKVVLLTVALVAYLVLFSVSLCSRWHCCDSPGNLTNGTDTLRWGPAARPDRGPSRSFHGRGLRARGPAGPCGCGWAACWPLYGRG